MHKLYKVRVEVEMFWWAEKPPNANDALLAECVHNELLLANGTRTYATVTSAKGLTNKDLISYPVNDGCTTVFKCLTVLKQ